jgi:hypothetical protein
MKKQTAKQRKTKASKSSGPSKALLISLVVGFVLFALFISLGVSAGVYKIVKSLNSNSKGTQVIQKQQYTTEFRNTVPSTCGYTLGQPTTVNGGEKYYEWLYEERKVGPNFRELAPKWMVDQGVLLTAMSYKSTDDSWKAEDKSEENPTYNYNFPGLVSYCINNPNSWDLDTFIENIRGISSDSLQYTVDPQKESWGEIEVQKVTVEGILQGSYVNEPFYLAVTSIDSDYSRLVIFQEWSSKEERLSTDIEAIKNSLKNRQMTSKLTPIVSENTATQAPTSTATAQSLPQEPSCETFKIYEGEFKSEGCYDSETLQDLQYYVNQYNSQIFTMNAAARSSQITCSGSDFFKDKCEEDKDRYEDAKDKKEEYEDKIRDIIK